MADLIRHLLVETPACQTLPNQYKQIPTAMLTLISCAKTMNFAGTPPAAHLTTPAFAAEAERIAMTLAQQDVEALGRMLRVKPPIAAENFRRFQEFHSPHTPTRAALFAYTGIVFKYLCSAGFTPSDLDYTQSHLRITSFLYGLLRPLDGIRPYRLEGDVRIPHDTDPTLFEHWRDILTPMLLADIAAAGGTLCNLASDEMRSLFHWNEVKAHAHIITPEFYVYKDGRPKTIVVYTKMARGAMTRFILTNRITSPEELKSFEWEGFAYNEEMSKADNRLVFTQ